MQRVRQVLGNVRYGWWFSYTRKAMLVSRNLSAVELFSDRSDRSAAPIMPEPEKPQLHLTEANNEACT